MDLKFAVMKNKSIVRTEELFPTFFSDFFKPWNDWFEDKWVKSVPAVNVTETDKFFNMELAAPGLEKGDFKIDVTGNMLTISAEKETEKKEEEKEWTRREYNYNSFSRTFTLPENILMEKIDAKYENGVLKLMLPKKVETKVPELKVAVK